MSDCDCECPTCSNVEEEVDTSEFEEKKSKDPTITAYKDALEKLTGIIKTASQSSDGKELSDEYWKEVGQLLKKAKLGISMKELGIDPEDANPTNADGGETATTKDTEIEPMGDTRDGDEQFDVAKDEKEAADAEDEKEKEEGGEKAPPPAAKKEAPPPPKKDDSDEDEKKDDSTEDEKKDDSDEDEKEDDSDEDEKKDDEDAQTTKSQALDEKAASATQQRLFGMVHAYQKGELDKKQVGGSLWEKIKKIADGISNKDVEDIAKTKHDDLPEKVPAETSEVNTKQFDDVTHLGIILESDDYKVVSSTRYDMGYVMEVSHEGRIHLIAVGDEILLEGNGYTFSLGNTSNFAEVVGRFAQFAKLDESELTQKYHRLLGDGVL